MMDIAIYGAGGLGKEVACLIQHINNHCPTWNLIGFFDDGVPAGTSVSHYGQVLGDIHALNAFPNELAIAVAVGNPTTVKMIVSCIANTNISYPNLIYPDLWVADKKTLTLGKGNIIEGACTLSCDVQIGDFNVLNGFINVGHDVQIGNFNTFMPGCRISGEVHIGEENLFGAGSFVLQQVHIGTNIKLAPGAYLFTHPKDGETYMGNPAKIFKY